MKFYLSSYKFGNEAERLGQMLPPGSRIGHINNSRDFTWADPAIRENYQQEEITFLNGLGFSAQPLDLGVYFGETELLRQELATLDGLWVSGGNTFVLRQAMRLSGFDLIFGQLKHRHGFLYAGYSAGICVLCDSLKYIQNVDDPADHPYAGMQETIWEGLGVFNYGLLPHYDSDHFESAAIGKEVQACIDNKWLFKALRDGEVIIIEDNIV
jgi:dipeptidase E